MKIISPGAEIIEDKLSELSLYQRISYVAGVCYQREPRKTEEEAQAFCKRMVEIGHHSTLEMAVVHLVMPAWCIPHPKYFSIEQVKGDRFLVSGSIRALIESVETYDVQLLLHNNLPLFFTKPEGVTHNDFEEEVFRFALPNEIPWQHKHVAVRFIVNRAVSHELVRHRPMSFLQESQRYCRYEGEVVFIRPEWHRKGDQERIWDQAVEDAEDYYKSLLLSGLKPQQARAVLPNSTKTELIAYASLPQWKHIFKLRCSSAADPEVRRVMIPLEQEFKAKYPEAFNE